MTRTFWLSFQDEDEHLGCCVVDVADDDVEVVPKPPRATDTAWADPEVRWLAAAMRLSWVRECNPGGAIAVQEIPTDSPVPRNRLLTGEELARWAKKPPVH